MSIQDASGNVLIEIREYDYIKKNPDNSYSSYKHYENIPLADGSIWNPSFLKKNPPVYLGVCEFSGHETKLIALSRGRICQRCGKLACPKHRVKRDDKWRCRRCDKIYLLKKLLLKIFFREIE
jgi:hypothetical protein